MGIFQDALSLMGTSRSGLVHTSCALSPPLGAESSPGADVLSGCCPRLRVVRPTLHLPLYKDDSLQMVRASGHSRSGEGPSWLVAGPD